MSEAVVMPQGQGQSSHHPQYHFININTNWFPRALFLQGFSAVYSTIRDRDEQRSVVPLGADKAQRENQPCNPDIQLSLSPKGPLQKC